MHHPVIAHPCADLVRGRCPVWCTCVYARTRRKPRRRKPNKPIWLPFPSVCNRSGEFTYHLLRSPPTRTKSILVHSSVTTGDHPVKVAKFAARPNLGVSARVSKNLKSARPPPPRWWWWWCSPAVSYLSLNSLSTCTGGVFPVTIPYAAESGPCGGLLKSPVRRTGPEDVAASCLPRIRRREAPYLRWGFERWSRWVLSTVSCLERGWEVKRAVVQIRVHPAPG